MSNNELVPLNIKKDGPDSGGGGDTPVAEVTMTAGKNGSTCTVNGNNGIKIGTSKLGGDMTISVPTNVTKVTLYAAA